MALRVGINGFGRIGRLVVRAAVNRGAPIEFVAVNDITDAATLSHLLKYDSVHRIWPKVGKPAEGYLDVAGKKIQVLSEKEPAKLPWKSLGVDVVLESTGKYTDKAGASQHLTAGARGVLISAPAKGGDLTFVIGVNDHLFDKTKHQVVSIGSCTTNCLAPVVKILSDTYGIERGFMTTIHAYTNDQKILDMVHKDLRRARAAGMSVIPTTTGAAKAVTLVLPELKGKIHGVAFRVPTSTVSLCDLVADLGKEVTAEDVNQAFKKASEGKLKGILEYCNEPLVSIDFKGNPASSTVDALSTMVIGGNMVKVLAWYDNEWGYSCRLADLIYFMAGKGL